MSQFQTARKNSGLRVRQETMPAACRDALDRADEVIEEMLNAMTPVLEATGDLTDDDVDSAEKNLSKANERFPSGLIDDYARARDECRGLHSVPELIIYPESGAGRAVQAA